MVFQRLSVGLDPEIARVWQVQQITAEMRLMGSSTEEPRQYQLVQSPTELGDRMEIWIWKNTQLYVESCELMHFLKTSWETTKFSTF